MTLTLTATPGTDGVVTVTVTGAADGALKLTRTDRNGYSVVRQAVGGATTGVRTVRDAECALGGSLRYFAQDTAGDYGQVTATLDAQPAVRQLRRVFRPEIKIDLEAVEGIDAARELRRTEHAPVGRPDPVFTTYKMGSRRGVMRLKATGDAAVADILRLYADGQVACVRMPDHKALDMFHIGLNVTPTLREVNAAGLPVWTVAVNYAETRPADALTLASWTCAELMARYPTAVLAGVPYATWQDLIDDRIGL